MNYWCWRFTQFIYLPWIVLLHFVYQYKAQELLAVNLKICRYWKKKNKPSFSCVVPRFFLSTFTPNLGQMRWQLCHAQVSRSQGKNKTWFIFFLMELYEKSGGGVLFLEIGLDSAGLDTGKGNGKRKFLLSPLCLIFELFHALWKQIQGYMALHIHSLLPLSAPLLVLQSSSLISVFVSVSNPNLVGGYY